MASHHFAKLAVMALAILLSSGVLAKQPRQDWQTDRPRLDQLAHYSGEEHHHRKFEELSPEEREAIIKRRQRFESLPSEKKQQIREARKRFKELPPERRKALKEKWDRMTPEQKRQHVREMEDRRSKDR